MRNVEAIFAALHDCGYSPLPISRRVHPTDPKPFGKAPGVYRGRDPETGDAQWRLLPGWQKHCFERASIHAARSWGRAADLYGGGLGVACGYNGLVAIDIDDDGIIEPLRAVLPAFTVVKKGRRGFSVFFRSDGTLPSTNYRTPKPDSRGLLDFLANGKQTVLPPSIHPDTGEQYVWLTTDTLLNTPLGDLPEFTSVHHTAMLKVLCEFGWNAPEPAQCRPDAIARPVRNMVVDTSGRIFVDDVNQTALANLDAWVPIAGFTDLQRSDSGYRAVATWRASGSGRSDAQRGANLSLHPNGIVDFGTGDGFTPIGVIAKLRGIPYPAAGAWLQEQIGMPKEELILLNAKRETLAPSYPDHARPLAEATEELRGVLSAFEPEMKAWRGYRNATRLKPPLIHRQPPFWLVRIDTAGGKTHEATLMTREWRQRGWRPIYVTHRIDLCDQAAKRIAAPDVTVRVHRGRAQIDPGNVEGKAMCQNLEAVQAALDLGVSVRPAVCERAGVRCVFFDDCGYEKQKQTPPDVWVVTSAMLLRERPEHIYEPDGLIFDEAFHENALGKAVSIGGAELEGATLDKAFTAAEIQFLTILRASLRSALKANGTGYLSREVLEANEITSHAALKASVLEQRPVNSDVLTPRMNETLRNGAVRRRGAKNKLLRNLGTLLEQIACFLVSDHSHCGRIIVGDGIVTVTPLLPVHPSWLAPALVLDATMTTPEIIDIAVFGDRVPGTASRVVSKADIAIKWPDHVHVRQYFGARVSKNALGLWEGATQKPSKSPHAADKAPKPQNYAEIARHILQRAAEAYPGRVGVVSYKGLRERFEADYPGVADWMHFNATSGRNDFENLEGLIVVGCIWNNPAIIEGEAAVFAGSPIPPQGEFYPRYIGGIRMNSGDPVPAFGECHPHPIAEAIRWGRTEGGLLQAVGRLRGPRRAEPCFLDIIGAVVLPVTVDAVSQWDDVKPKAEAYMMPYGMVLTNVSDAMRAFRLTEDAARGVGALSNDIYLYRMHRLLPVRKVQYKKMGAGQKVWVGYALTDITGHGEAGVRDKLIENVGPLASVIVERVRAKDSPYGRDLLANAWRETEDQFSEER